MPGVRSGRSITDEKGASCSGIVAAAPDGIGSAAGGNHRYVIRKVIYGPPNWLVDKLSAEDRRMFGFWTIVLAIVGAFFWGREVLFVSILSIVALIPNYASETPVEIEPTPTESE